MGRDELRKCCIGAGRHRDAWRPCDMSPRCRLGSRPQEEWRREEEKPVAGYASALSLTGAGPSHRDLPA